MHIDNCQRRIKTMCLTGICLSSMLVGTICPLFAQTTSDTDATGPQGISSFPWGKIAGEPLAIFRISLDGPAFDRYAQLWRRIIEYHKMKPQNIAKSEEGPQMPQVSIEYLESLTLKLQGMRETCKKNRVKALWLVQSVCFPNNKSRFQYPRAKLTCLVEHGSGVTVPAEGWKETPIIRRFTESSRILPKPINDCWTLLHQSPIDAAMYEASNIEQAKAQGEQIIDLLDKHSEIAIAILPSMHLREYLLAIDMTNRNWNTKKVRGFTNPSDAPYIRNARNIIGQIILSPEKDSRLVFRMKSEQHAEKMALAVRTLKQHVDEQNYSQRPNVSVGAIMRLIENGSVEIQENCWIIKMPYDNLVHYMARPR